MAKNTNLTWYRGAALIFTVSPTIDGTPETTGHVLYLSSDGRIPLDERVDATEYVTVSGDDLRVELPASLRGEHRWWRMDVAPGGQTTTVAYGRLNLRDV